MRFALEIEFFKMELGIDTYFTVQAIYETIRGCHSRYIFRLLATYSRAASVSAGGRVLKFPATTVAAHASLRPCGLDGMIKVFQNLSCVAHMKSRVSVNDARRKIVTVVKIASSNQTTEKEIKGIPSGHPSATSART